MPTTDDLPATDRDTLPEFDLEYRCDDPVDPSAVTVFPAESDSPDTEWVTVDYATAVPLTDVP